MWQNAAKYYARRLGLYVGRCICGYLFFGMYRWMASGPLGYEKASCCKRHACMHRMILYYSELILLCSIASETGTMINYCTHFPYQIRNRRELNKPHYKKVTTMKANCFKSNHDIQLQSLSRLCQIQPPIWKRSRISLLLYQKMAPTSPSSSSRLRRPQCVHTSSRNTRMR